MRRFRFMNKVLEQLTEIERNKHINWQRTDINEAEVGSQFKVWMM